MPISPTPDKLSLDYEELGRIQFPFKEWLDPFFHVLKYMGSLMGTQRVANLNKPDIMITPSDLVPCVRSLSDQSFFLNPGRLTKGRGGGSFALVQFNSNGHKVRINKIWFMHMIYMYIILYQSYSMTHANNTASTDYL